MSKLASAIRDTCTGQHKIDYMPRATIAHTLREDVVTTQTGYLTEYSIEARVGARVFIRQQSELPFAIQDVKSAILEEVFGEFRGYFKEAHMALWNRDFDEAMKVLGEMERQMYG
jgi:hypothetical protein